MTIVDKVFIPWSTFLRAWRSFSAVWLWASSSKLPQWASAPPCAAVLGPASSASTTGDDRHAHVVEWWNTAASHTTTHIQINMAIPSNTGHGEGNHVANGSKSSNFDRFGWFELHHNVAGPFTYMFKWVQLHSTTEQYGKSNEDQNYSTLHADSPLSAKLWGKFSAPRIYQFFQSPFSSEFSHFFLHGYFIDRQKINSANCRGFPPRNSGETKWRLSMISVLNCIKLGNLCALVQKHCYSNRHIHVHVYTCSCHFLSISLRFTWNSNTVNCYYVKHEPLFTFHNKQNVHVHVAFR